MDPCGGEDGTWNLQVKDKPGKIYVCSLQPSSNKSNLTEWLRHVVGQDYSQHLTVIPKGQRLRCCGYADDQMLVLLMIKFSFADHANERYGRHMLGFTLGLPVRPHAYLVSDNYYIVAILVNITKINMLLLIMMLFRTVEGR